MSSVPSITQTPRSRKRTPTMPKPSSKPRKATSVAPDKRPRSKGVTKRVLPATDRQTEWLEAVVLLTDKLGRAPDNRDVAEHMGVTRWGARRQLMALEAKGLVSDVPKTVSSGQWALTDAARRVRAGG